MPAAKPSRYVSRRSILRATAWSASLLAVATTLTGSASMNFSKRAVVYGGTPSGIMAAIAAARGGLDVTLLLGESPLGGMMASGLSRSDVVAPATLGGLGARFFNQVGTAYGITGPIYNFEPHIAAKVFRSMMTGYDVRVTEGVIRRVTKYGSALRSISVLDGSEYPAEIFIDASYEATLLQLAGVRTTHGREPAHQYGESAAGYLRYNALYPIENIATHGRQPDGLMPLPDELVGQGDLGIMAYNYRLCLSKDPTNSRPFAKPPGYNPSHFALLGRSLRNGIPFMKPLSIPGGKFDLNGGGFFDSDYVGASWAFPTANLAGRRAIAVAHRRYLAGLLYYTANDPSVPQAIRGNLQQYGLAKDEFPDNENWPLQLYLRETRRMVGAYVIRQADLQVQTSKSDSIGVGSYPLDCHHVRRFVSGPGTIAQEGGIPPAIREVKDYDIPFAALLPSPRDATNLLSSVCISSTHVAWCSLRVEPTFMILGEAAGVAASLACATDTPLHQLGSVDLQRALRDHAVVLKG